MLAQDQNNLSEVQAVPLSLQPPRISTPKPTAEVSEGQLGSQLQFVNLELTTRCTFRCTYCTHSSSKWSEQDYPLSRIEEILDAIIALGVPSVGLSGSGESTMLPHWQRCAKRFLDAGVKVSIISNFDRSFTAEEILVLARFTGITVSVDTVDYQLAREIRRKGDINRILLNIARVKAAAVHNPAPHFGINVVVAGTNVFGLADLVKLGLQLGVSGYFFGALRMMPASHHDARMERERNMFPLDNLPAPEKIRALAAIVEAERLVANAGGNVTCSDDLKTSLVSVAPPPIKNPFHHTSEEGVVGSPSDCPPKALTRSCLRPWTEVFIRATEELLPCCYWREGSSYWPGASSAKATDSEGTVNPRSHFDGPAIRAAKVSLLSGDLQPCCANCPIYPMVSTDALVARVNRLLGLAGDASAMLTSPEQAQQYVRENGIQRHFSFLDQLKSAELRLGSTDQRAIWSTTLGDRTDPALFLHPPAQLQFTLQGGGRGRLSFAVAVHPEAWGKPNSGACHFLVTADGRVTWSLTLDPTRNQEERCWHEFSLEVPHSQTGVHEIVFATQAVGVGATYRWALWRAPQFTWDVAAGGKTSTPR